MRAVIVGAGEVGYHIASRLLREQHDVVMIDQAEELVEQVREDLDVMAYQGHGADPGVLEQAAIAHADMLIAVTSTDEVNLVACILARHYGVQTRIARINDPDFHTTALVDAGKHIGIDLMVNPSQAVAAEIGRLVRVPGADEAADFLEGRVKLLSIRVRPHAPIVNQRLRDIAARFAGSPSALIAAIQREQETLIPNGNTRILPGDHLLIIGKDGALQANLHLLGLPIQQARTILIIGGGEVGLHVAHTLEKDEAHYSVKLLERNTERCKVLAEHLSRTLVQQGDPTDLTVLQGEGIAGVDAVIVVTDDEGTNMIAALLAKTHGAANVMALIKRPALVPLIGTLGIDAVISPRLITADAILRRLRRGQILSIFTSTSTEAETLEMVAMPRAKIVGKPLHKLRMPAGVIIGAVAHGDQVMIPRGSTTIQAHDRVIVFALPHAVSQAAKLFGG